MLTDYLQVLLALGAVLGVMGLLFALVRRLHVLPGGHAGPIRVLSAISIGAKERLLLVQVGEEQILLSAAPGGVRKIHALDKPLNLLQGPAGEGGKGFGELLQGVLAGRKS